MLRSARALRALVSTLALCTSGGRVRGTGFVPAAAGCRGEQSRIGRRLVPSLLRHKQFRAQRTGTDDRQTGRICRREHRLHARNGHREDRSHRRPTGQHSLVRTTCRSRPRRPHWCWGAGCPHRYELDRRSHAKRRHGQRCRRTAQSGGRYHRRQAIAVTEIGSCRKR